MKINADFTVMVVGKRTNKGKDGKEYYSLAVVSTDGEADNMSCPQMVYQEVEPLNMYDLSGEYDTRWKSFRITKVIGQA